jgi:CDP-4-dehydro-6-deoxyglucose reductase
MTVKIRFLPSQHKFIAERNETILDAALRAGLSVNYGCTNGTCGQCKAKVISGQLEKLRFHDYIIGEAEKIQGYVLMCSNTALSDTELEVSEAHNTHDIPKQHISVRVKKIETPLDHIMILQLRASRTKTLRFIAGQRCTLKFDNSMQHTLSIASCPCDVMNLQFHIRKRSASPVTDYLHCCVNNSSTIDIEGPNGDFILDEESERPLIFLAYDTGFGAIKSLIEHALSLELSQPMHLFWLAPFDQSQYMHNYCRAIADAMDNFQYTPITGLKGEPTPARLQEAEEKITMLLQTPDKLAAAIKEITDQYPDLSGHDLYLCAPTPIVEVAKPLFHNQGLPDSRLFVEVLD